jgi:hypothetical protein
MQKTMFLEHRTLMKKICDAHPDVAAYPLVLTDKLWAYSRNPNCKPIPSIS